MNDSPLKVWLERDGALLRLRLARPKANLIDAEMISALSRSFVSYQENKGVLAALVDHEGPHFSFGASVEEHLPEQCEQMLKKLHSLIGTMLAWPKPILIAAHGQCLGGGLEFALAGSLLFVGRDSKLGQPELKLGVFAPAASVLLPLRIGQGRAEDLLSPAARSTRRPRSPGALRTRSPRTPRRRRFPTSKRICPGKARRPSSSPCARRGSRLPTSRARASTTSKRCTSKS